MAITASKMGAMQPLPLAPSGSVHVAGGVDFLEDAEGNGSVFLWGMAAWCWRAGDTTARRLAGVQLVDSKAARQRPVADAFGVHENSLVRWRSAYRAGGASALATDRPGPRGPSKLTEAKRAEIAALRASGLSLAAVASRTGVSTDTVRRATVLPAPPRVPGAQPEDGPTAGPEDAARLVPLASPLERGGERALARFGIINDAPPVICEGASLPLVGTLLILPALAATGLLEIAARVYGARAAAFYSLRSLVCSIVFACLLGEPRAEGFSRLSPKDLGRLVGLDRGPEVTTIRRRIEELARMGRADQLVDGLARHHTAAHHEAAGIFYIDGHVRAYHGRREVPKAHVARIRLAMPAELDTWVCDANGDGVLVWSAEPGASLVGELRATAARVRALVGADARPTICFDRGGWSPKLFKELDLAGFDILTYRKKPAPSEPRRAFHPYTHTAHGHEHHYLLADRKVTISYEGARRRFTCRQITRLDHTTGHQTQVLTTRADEDPAAIAHLMFSRWSQENFFRYMRAHYALDALDSYATEEDDPARSVPNPARKAADRALAAARRASVRPRRTRGGPPSVGGCRYQDHPGLQRRPGRDRAAGPGGQGDPDPRHPRAGPPPGGPHDPRAQAHPRCHPHGHPTRSGPRPPARPPLPPSGRRGTQPAARGVRRPGRSRGRRGRAPRAARSALGTTTHRGHRRALRGPDRYQDHLPGHRSHPRLLGQERVVTTQR